MTAATGPPRLALVDIDVALAPALFRSPDRCLVVVVDLLRATTSLTAMFDAGADAVAVSGSERQARRLAAARGWLLAGEVGGLPPAGFDCGNSPRELAAMDLRGRRLVMYTTNGTRAFLRAARAPLVLAGALRNRRAVAGLAVREAAARGLDLCVLCAGLAGGRAIAVEDVLAAGALVEAATGPGVALHDGALTALAAWRSARHDLPATLRRAPHGAYLVSLGFAGDLDFARRLDVSDVVPCLGREGDILLLTSQPGGERATLSR